MVLFIWPNEILKYKQIKKALMNIANMSRPFAFQIVLLENLNGIEVRPIGHIGRINACVSTIYLIKISDSRFLIIFGFG